MKIFLTLVLGLAVATESWASVVPEPPPAPSSKVEDLLEEWKGHLQEATQAAQRTWHLVEKSKTYNTLIFPAAFYLGHWITVLPLEVKEAADVAIEVPLSIGRKASEFLEEVGNRLRPTPEEFLASLKDRLASYLDPVLEEVGPYLEPSRRTFLASLQELDRAAEEKLGQQLQFVDSLLPVYLEKLQSEEASLKAFHKWAEEQLHQTVEALRESLKRSLEPFLEKRRQYWEAFEEWRKTPVFPPKQP